MPVTSPEQTARCGVPPAHATPNTGTGKAIPRPAPPPTNTTAPSGVPLTHRAFTTAWWKLSAQQRAKKHANAALHLVALHRAGLSALARRRKKAEHPRGLRLPCAKRLIMTCLSPAVSCCQLPRAMISRKNKNKR